MAPLTPTAGLDSETLIRIADDGSAAAAILGSVFEQFSMATVVVAPDPPRWTVLLVNTAYLAATGRRRNELVGRGLFDAFPESPETTQEHGALRIADSFERVLESHTPDIVPLQRYDLQDKAPDGAPSFETHYWQMTTRPVLSPDARRVIALLHEVADVTAHAEGRRERRRLSDQLAERTADAERARRAAEEALQRATVLQRVTAALSSALTLQEAAALVVEQSTAALGAWGGVVVRPTADGRRIELVRTAGYAEDVRDRWREFSIEAPVPLAEVIRTREPVFVESVAEWEARYGARRELVDGVPRSAAWAAFPLIADGRVLGAMGLSFTRERALDAEDQAFAIALAQQCAQAFERARLFDAEREARAAAEAANRSKSEFLSTMSHELRTPLNAIGGYVQLMEMGLRGPVTDQQRDALSRIQRSQNHLLGLINEVLNYARLESGRVTYDLAPTDVAQVLSVTAPLVEPQRAAKQIALVLPEPDASRPRMHMHADAEKLEQILLNLLSNAVKFTLPGGCVSVVLRTRGESPEMAELQVLDTGIGIPADKLSAIFEPFVQIGRTFSNPREGVGLGLAISRDLARGMGGNLTVESTPGEGSTFTLTLPLATTEE